MESSTLDWLPYADTPVSDADYASAKAAIDREVEIPIDTSSSGIQNHPQMRTFPTFSSTPIGLDLMARASRGEKLAAIDMSRYEAGALEAPAPSGLSEADQAAEWKRALERAATLQSYLALRADNLSLLEAFGKNAWLIGNDNTERELRALEQALAESKERLHELELQRRVTQEAGKAELDALADEWRRRVVGKTETEIATAQLRHEIEALKST